MNTDDRETPRAQPLGETPASVPLCPVPQTAPSERAMRQGSILVRADESSRAPKKKKRRLSSLVARHLARLLSTGVHTIRACDTAGKLPTRIGSKVVLVVAEIRDWPAASTLFRYTREAKVAWNLRDGVENHDESPRDSKIDVRGSQANTEAATKEKQRGSTLAKPASPTDQDPKRSTRRGEGQAKLISALMRHHKYGGASRLNLEPVGLNKLAKAAGVSTSTASVFFTKYFQGHATYQAVCSNGSMLAGRLKRLNGDFSPIRLYGSNPDLLCGSNPAAENDRDE